MVHIWLVVWNMNFTFPYIGMSSSQLNHIFRGVEATNQSLYPHYSHMFLGSNRYPISPVKIANASSIFWQIGVLIRAHDVYCF